MKGVSGHLMAAILVIVGSIIAIIFFYMFNKQVSDWFLENFSRIVSGFKQTICDLLPWFVKLMGAC